MLNLILALLWGVVTLMHLIMQQPVSWWLYVIATAMLTLEYIGRYFREDR